MGGAKTTIGSFVHIASFTSITGGGEFLMEDFAGLSSGVQVYTGNEDYFGGCLTNPTVPFPYRVPIRSFVQIKKHAIMGANTVILPGVVIGEGGGYRGALVSHKGLQAVDNLRRLACDRTSVSPARTDFGT